MLLLMTVSAALSFAIGGIFMEWSDGLSKPLPSLLVYVMFALGASCQALATHESGMGLAYVLVVGLEVVLAVIFSVVFFKEGYSFTKLIGVLLVTIGVVLLKSSAISSLPTSS